jgi:predicted nucleic acid-binding protein
LETGRTGDCLSFCLMKERAMREALTIDAHFGKAGFVPLLVN